MERKDYTTVSECQEVASLYLASLLEDSSNVSTLLFLSGGSCFTLLPLLSHWYFEKAATLENLTIGMVDERFDQEKSNYVILHKEYPLVVNVLKKKGATVIDTSPKLKDQFEMAEWYEKELRMKNEELRIRKGGIITLLGMGEDGHIAGILPHPNEEKVFYDRFLDTEKLVVGYDATGKNEFAKRYTLTYPGLLLADEVIGYITGQKKQEALTEGIREARALHLFPALYFSQTPQPCHLFCAQE